MKKYLLLIAVLFLLVTAKANEYSIGFTSKSVRIPYGETALGYMPKARVTFPSGGSIVSADTEYEYGTGDITMWDLETYKPGTYSVECSAKSDEYNTMCVEIISVVIYDNVPPVIYCDDIVACCGDVININDYASVVDNCDNDIILTTSEINTKDIGERVFEIRAEDKEGNISKHEVRLTIYDKVEPVITLKERQLSVNNGYNLLDNVSSVRDNYSNRGLTDVKVTKEKIGSNYYQITYQLEDESGNIAIEKAFLRYNFPNAPVIELIDTANEDALFDPLGYVKAVDVEDGDLTKKIVVIETNIKEKYCIYEVNDSDGNYVRQRFYFENLGKKNRLFFPESNDIVVEQPAAQVIEKKSKTYIIYIVGGVLVAGFATYKIIRHFKKKNDIIKSE